MDMDDAQLAAEEAELRARLEVIAARRAAVARAAPQALPQPVAALSPANGDDHAREMRREANTLLSNVRNSARVKELLAALATDYPRRSLTLFRLKTHVLNVCTEMRSCMDTASQRTQSIVTAETFNGLTASYDELRKFNDALPITLSNICSAKAYNRIVRLLNSKPMELEIPPAVSDMSAGPSEEEDAPTAAVTTEEESNDEVTDSEGEEPSAALVIDVERTQSPPAADAPEKVREAFDLIMGCASLRKKLRFGLAPFLLRVHENIKSGLDACRQMQYGVIDQSETAKMFGGGKTQARKA